MPYPELENFISRVKRLQASNSTEMRITKEEALKISIELTELLLKRPTEKIIISRPSESKQVDGGTF